MSRSPSTAVSAAVALVTGVATLLTGAATGASAADLQHSSLSIATAHHAVKPGGSDTVTGGLRARPGQPLPGRTVTLEARATGESGFTPIGTTTSGARGGVHLMVTPAASTAYRWDFAGDNTTRASHSGVARVLVRVPAHPPTRRPAALSIRLAHPRVSANSTDRVSGRLRSRHVALRHRMVLLLSREKGATKWAFDGARRTNRHGHIAFTVRPETITRYRMVFLGTPNIRRAASATVRVAMRANALSISASPRWIDNGQTSTVSGVLTNKGAPDAGMDVRLREKRTGTHHGFTTVGTAATGTDGSVSFPVTPTHSTTYRLVLPHTAGVPAARSHLTTVWVRHSTSLSILGRTTRHGNYAVGGVLHGNGRTLAHRRVTLQQQLSGESTWSDVATHRTGRRGGIHFREPAAPGTAYRLSYAGGPRFAPGVSGVVSS